MLPTPSWLRFRKSRQVQRQQQEQERAQQQSSQQPPGARLDSSDADHHEECISVRPAIGVSGVGGGGAGGPGGPAASAPTRTMPAMRRALANLVQRALSPIAGGHGGHSGQAEGGQVNRRAAKERRPASGADNNESAGLNQGDSAAALGLQMSAGGTKEANRKRRAEQLEDGDAKSASKQTGVCETIAGSHATPPKLSGNTPLTHLRQLEPAGKDLSIFKPISPVAQHICQMVQDKRAPLLTNQKKNELGPLCPIMLGSSNENVQTTCCQLTARTNDNHCALHGSNQQQAVCTNSLADRTVPISLDSPRGLRDTLQAKHSGQTDLKPEVAQLKRDSTLLQGEHASQPNSLLLTATKVDAPDRPISGGRRWRRRQKRALATWPLARQALNDSSTFGDAEDISSAHLAGRLIKLDEAGGDWSLLAERTGVGGGGTIDSEGQSSRPPSGKTTEEGFGRKLDASITAVPSNYNHKRPFGEPFERPSAGWLYNATATPPFKRSLKLFSLGSNFQAKPLATDGLRRRSYDDQEGDNDINIILQPSDLDGIEKRAISHNNIDNNNGKNKNKALSRGEVVASKFRTPITNLADLKMAKCLLDQDYNLTVRLFISKSALNWNFNSFTFDAMCCGRSLTELLLHLFDYYNLHNIFNLDMVNVLKCFRLLEFGYHSTNPYHNSIHAADVTQAMHCFIQESKIRKHMTHLETLCSILAAVCHDLDHPGVNQSFLVATNNPLASLYNNNSVLENHHWRFALCIFKESKLFDHFEEEVLEEMKKQLKHLILATDIARQNEYLKRFKDLTSSHKFSMQNTDDRALVLQMALKCADLGNPCRPWLISRVWSNLICDEFYKMGRIERQLGIPLTPICQREKTSIAGIQTDFFRFIVLPLLELWHKFLRSPLSDLLMSNFDHNYQRWQRANRIVQQLRRRKSVACLEPIADAAPDELSVLDQHITLGSCSKHSFAAIKRASSDYIKSGNGRLELLRNFQLDRIIERSPLVLKNSQRKDPHKPNPESKKLASNKCSSFQVKRDSKGKNSDSKSIEQQQKPSRCSQAINNPSRNLTMCSYRKALSPIEDGDAPSPDQQQHLKQTILCNMSSAFPPSPQSGTSSSSSSSSLASHASSACSSPVIHRSTSRASIDQIIGNSATVQAHQNIKQQHLQHHPFLAQYYESSGGGNIRPSNPNSGARLSTASTMPQSRSLYNYKRRESDPGCSIKYDLAAAIVLIQFQNNSFFHKRRSSLPICVPKRRSSK